jgi:hypothetical protein
MELDLYSFMASRHAQRQLYPNIMQENVIFFANLGLKLQSAKYT